MYLVYMDESGNTGKDLNNPDQPVFLLCAMLIEIAKWHAIEADLQAELDKHFPAWRTIEGFEVHGTDLRTGSGFFKHEKDVAKRLALRDAWMDVGAKYGAMIFYRQIEKKRFAKWLAAKFGSNLQINPHVVAFSLVARCVNDYLRQTAGATGVLISDDNREVAKEVENTIRLLRGEGDYAMKLDRIVEKGFFIDSSKSLLMQLCDLYTLTLRKHAEAATSGTAAKEIDASGFNRALSRVVRGDERFDDVTAWFMRQRQPIPLPIVGK